MATFRNLVVHAIGVGFIQRASAVSYESDQNTGVAEKYTFIAIGGVLVIPIVFGWIYTRITLRRFLKLNSSNEAKSGLVSDSSGSSAAMRQAFIGAHLARLLDMKSNPVLRLWWKRQDKLYNLNNGENDLEAGISDERKLQPQNPKSKPKKEKHHKRGSVEESSTAHDLPPVLQETVSESAKQQKKEKKHRKHESRVESAEAPVRSEPMPVQSVEENTRPDVSPISHDTAGDNGKQPSKEKKHHRHEQRVESSELAVGSEPVPGGVPEENTVTGEVGANKHSKHKKEKKEQSDAQATGTPTPEESVGNLPHDEGLESASKHKKHKKAAENGPTSDEEKVKKEKKHKHERSGGAEIP